MRRLPFLTLLVAVAASGAWLENVPVTLPQPDGTVVEALVSGDEFHHWIHRQGYPVLVGEDGFAYWAGRRGGEVVATRERAGGVPWIGKRLWLGIARDARLDPKPANRFEELVPRGEPRAAASEVQRLNNLVFFIRFAGETEFPAPLIYFDGLHNSPSGNSVAAYFSEESLGRMIVSSTFYPLPVSPGVVLSYQDSHPRGYYQPRTAANPEGYRTDNEIVSREQSLLARVVTELGPQVPGSLDVDADRDGKVDNVTFIVRGAPDGWSDLLWPHRWVLYAAFADINNKRVYSFNFQLESVLDVGVLCHELSHTLGVPDYYRYPDCSTAANVYPVERWDLMSHDLNPPQHHLWWTKQRYLGWRGEAREITGSGIYSLGPNEAAYVQAGSERLYFEYRRRGQTFDSLLPGSGLIAYRVNPAIEEGNRCGPPDEVYVYRPGGNNGGNGSPGSAAMSSDRSAMNDVTDPAFVMSNGTRVGVFVSNVAHDGTKVHFMLALRQGVRRTVPPTSSGGS